MDFDFYVFGEGNYYCIYEKFGVYLMMVDGVKGVYFVVWVFNVCNVFILGDFNNWDGRLY